MYNRIISLLPPATEIICALGLAYKLVGRSHECDYPPAVLHLPVCTQVNIPEGFSSAAIDQQVKHLMRNALSVFSIDKALIKGLEPDLIITHSQCGVGAVSLDDVEKAVRGFTGKPVKVIALHSESLEDIFDDIKAISAVLDVTEAGTQLVEELQDRANLIRHKLKYIWDKPSVACIEWLDPVLIAGNWIPGLVEIAGGAPVLAEKGKPSHYFTREDILLQNPDILIIMPCGFTIERTLGELQLLLNNTGFNQLKAVKNNKIYIADGNKYFNRPGPRIVDSLEILAEILNPKQFIFGYEGDGWIRFSV